MKKIILGIFILLAIVYTLHAFPVLAQFGLEDTAKEANLLPKSGDAPGPAALIGTFIGYGLSFVGVIFFLLMMYGGFLWMTARGNTATTEKAQKIIEMAVIGMAIIFLSYVVTNFVVSRLTSGAGVNQEATTTP